MVAAEARERSRIEEAGHSHKPVRPRHEVVDRKESEHVDVLERLHEWGERPRQSRVCGAEDESPEKSTQLNHSWPRDCCGSQ